MNKKITFEKKIYILTGVIYFLLTAAVSLISIFGDNIRIGSLTVNNMGINSIIVSIQIMLMLFLIITKRREGFRFSLILAGINILALSIPLIFFNIKENILPIVMQVISLVLNTVVYFYAMKLDKKERELMKIAYTDALTNIPNQEAFIKHVMEVTDVSNIVTNKNVAVVFADLDRFKVVSDSVGKKAGDDVLVELVTRWKYVMTENDTIARLDGDMFGLIIEDFKDKTELRKHIEEFEACVRRKVSVNGIEFFMSACFGVSMYPENTLDGEELLMYADLALFKAKESAAGTLVFFDKYMMDVIEIDRNIENSVMENINNGTFTLMFQPQFDTANKKLRGFETLLRMNDSKGNPVSPAKFIPLAEKNGSILEIDRFVLNKAMETFRDIVRSPGNENLTISVNISAVHLLDADLYNDVKTALEVNDFPAENLEIEITESVFITSITQAAEVLNSIKSLGIRIALDDFGTGYASLSYLKKLPIDLLKIDKSFVDELDNGDESSDFIAAIISMGHLLKFRVISEGVEHKVQLDTLKRLNCDYIQGYLWGKPMDIDNVRELIEEEEIS